LIRRTTNNPCALAAKGGHLEALRWARQRDCPWDEHVCEWAALGGLPVGW